MAVAHINPEELAPPSGYHHIAVATGTRTAYLSGQVARTADGTLVGADDLASQIEQAYINIATAVAAIGGTSDDIVKLTLYVVDWHPEKIVAVSDGITRAAQHLGVDPRTATTLVGVTALAEPELLVEIDAVAVLS